VLLSFRFANHRSFRDEQHLNFTPIYGSRDIDDSNAFEAVPVVGIFGANASGKSNVVSAFDYVSRMVGTSDRESEPGIGPTRQPFRLDLESSREPSSYVVDLMLDGVRYTYGFALDDEKILEEWLYSYPFRKKRVVFERTEQDFEWGEESRRSSIRRLTDIISQTALFLSVSARFTSRTSTNQTPDETSDVLHSVYTWLWQRMVRARALGVSPTIMASNFSRSLANPSRRALVVDLLRAADVGLRDVLVLEPEEDDELSTQVSRRGTELTKPEQDRIRRMARREGRVQFLHHGAIDDVLLDLTDESSGTLRLLDLAARGISVLERGGLFLVDEIDASLHPLLTASLVRLFGLSIVNRSHAQLVSLAMMQVFSAILMGKRC
jgi:AAA15 family ATPase/GTPase